MRILKIPYLPYSPITPSIKGVNTVREAFQVCSGWAKSVTRKTAEGSTFFEVTDQLPDGYKSRKLPLVLGVR